MSMDQEEVIPKPKRRTAKAEEHPPKDVWDKLDILGRAAIPVIVALSVYLWNSERTSRDTASQMIAVATAILTAPPEQSAPSALRGWAIAVLQSPHDPPLLTEAAALALQKEALPSQPWGTVDPEKLRNWMFQGSSPSEEDAPSSP